MTEPHTDPDPTTPRVAEPSEPVPVPVSGIVRALDRASAYLDRYPWLLPSASFAIGWLGFFLFHRRENLARVIAAIALIGWVWLLAENLLGRWLVTRSRGRLSIGAVRFVTQQIQQEILFFALPFLFAATLGEPGQMLFMGGAIAVAVLITVDPIYLHRIAPHAGLSSALNAYCTLIAALVVLPVAVHLPLDQALPLALAVTLFSLLASLPRMLRSTDRISLRVLGMLAIPCVMFAAWGLRSWIPPAGLWVRDARITDRVDAREPGASIRVLEAADLHANGVVAFVAVHAPTGLSQAVVFEWRHHGVLIDPIPAEISGGREEGFRTYSRKQNFPEEARGMWRVDLLTPQRQLIARMRFEVR